MMFRVTTVPILISLMPINYVSAESDPKLLCMWTIKDKKNTSLNEDFMKGPCIEKTLSGMKFYSSLFEVQGRKFKVEYLEEPKDADPFKARVNGKIGTMAEDNRYAKHFTADDLSIEFSYDTVLNDPKLTKRMIQGAWSENKKYCNATSTITIKGDMLVRYGGESQCSIYSVGRTTVADNGMIMMKCNNEGTANYEALSFETSNKGREAYIDGISHRFKCGR